MMVFIAVLGICWLLCCGLLGMSVCMGVLREMCLGVGWLRAVMASVVDVDASFGILNSMIPSHSDVVYESRFCGCVELWKI